MINPGLTDKVAIVTGANNPHGIGAGVALALADQGVAILLHYYRGSWKGGNEAGATESNEPGEAFYNAQGRKPPDEVLAEIEAVGGRAVAVEGDLSDPAGIPHLFDIAEQHFGPVNILVNNAAYWEGDTFVPPAASVVNEMVEMWTSRPGTISPSSIDKVFAVNTRAVALLMAEFAYRHRQHNASWGRIVNISTAGAYCFPSEVTYGASKSALEAYSRSAAVELAQFGITVNTIAPGPVQTGWITPELAESILPTIPLNRIGTPADIADAVVFLASEQARWITAQHIFVGGGHGM